MAVATRSKSSKTRSGKVLRKSAPLANVKARVKSAKKKSQAESRSLMAKDAANLASEIMPRIFEAARVGSRISSDWHKLFNYHPTLVRYLSDYLRRRTSDPTKKLWLFIASEGLSYPKSDVPAKIADRPRLDQNVPVIVSIESDVEPINYMVKYSAETQYKMFSSFRKLGLWWKNMGDFCVLKSCRDDDSEHALLPLAKPSVVHALRCDSVLSGDTCDQITAQRRVISNRSEKKHFSDMIHTLASKKGVSKSVIEASIEVMKVFKIYPEHGPNSLPVEGTVKNDMLHALYEKVDGYY